MIAALMMLGAASAGAPGAAEIEDLLQRKEYCSATVDGCRGADGGQVRFNTRYAVSNVVCEDMGTPMPDNGSWRCSYDVRQTRWMEGEQLGEAETSRMTDIFDFTRYTIREGGKDIHAAFWRQRSQTPAQD